MSNFSIKRNDRRESIERVLKGSDGAPVDLTGCSVRFLMRYAQSNTLKVDATATVVDAAAGQVRYAWTADDTSDSGAFKAEFEVLFADGTRQSFPNTTYITVVILDDLG